MEEHMELGRTPLNKYLHLDSSSWKDPNERKFDEKRIPRFFHLCPLSENSGIKPTSLLGVYFFFKSLGISVQRIEPPGKMAF